MKRLRQFKNLSDEMIRFATTLAVLQCRHERGKRFDQDDDEAINRHVCIILDRWSVPLPRQIITDMQSEAANAA